MRNSNKLFLSFLLLMACSGTAVAMPEEARAIIDFYGMSKIPHEGPWFLQTHKSDEVVGGDTAARYPGPRYTYSAIVAVATRKDFSAMHRLGTDELWHFYGGNPSEMLLLYPDGNGQVKVLGPDIEAGQQPQIMVPRGTWMGARPIGVDETAYTFASNTLAPAFEYEDYEIGYRDELIRRYPKFAAKIAELTRNDSISRPAEIKTVESRRRVLVEQLVGRKAAIKSSKVSVAKFTIDAKTETVSSLNLKGNEVIVVDSGEGFAVVGGKRIPVQRGSVVLFPAGVKHRVIATRPLVLYAVVAPAYSPSDNHTFPEEANDE